MSRRRSPLSLMGANSVALSPDGRVLAADNGLNAIVLLDVASGSETRRLTGHSSRVPSVAFSPDGSMLAAAGGNTIKLWDVASGHVLRSLDGSASSVAFSPVGHLLAAAKGGATSYGTR